ncbi:glutathione S-transferase N-terminal domain-containing protein [Shewanella sp. UCD-KL12]|uniref:glutathione S-transferase N-terminal domain-containing protein n=1 Tax=Shewanella sp. UCD-KL12 TaxID=1917163 RepID=UPI000970A50D|nr:glutathione S-transferase N-terminal domain-containing protein [Shewanella sp. UCD-KL12]
MKLFYSDASPYARCVRVIIRYFEISTISEVQINPLENSEQLLNANPLAKIPCLQLSDGSSLFDSEVILRFLDHEFGDDYFFGKRETNWSSETQFSLIKGMLDSAVALRQEQMREEEGNRSPFWCARLEQAIYRGLSAIEHSGITTESYLTIHQIMLACLLEYLDFRHEDMEWRKLAPATSIWLDSFENLQVFKSTRPI